MEGYKRFYLIDTSKGFKSKKMIRPNSYHKEFDATKLNMWFRSFKVYVEVCKRIRPIGQR